MSNFKERHPPMGSEKDIECQTTSITSIIDKCVINSSSSSSEELDELSLRVRALLAESDDEQIPEFSSKESQASPLPSEAGTESHISCSSVNLDSQCKANKVIFQKKESDHAAESFIALKDSASNTNYDVQDSLSYSYSSEVFQRKNISVEEHSEGCKAEDLYSRSDITIIEDPHSNMLHPSVPPVKSFNELEISKDSSSYYAIDEGLEKQTVNYPLKGRCCGVQIPILDTPFSPDNELFYYTPCESKQTLSVDKRNDNSNYARFSPQHLREKEEKECPSLSKYSDCDTPSLSVSSIASSKRLEWDNAADIGYTRDTIDESSSQRKSRKEPEGFSLVAHKINYGSSSKYSNSANQPVSAKNTDIFERGYTSQVSQTPNLNERCDTSDNSFIKKDFFNRDKSVTEANLEYSNTKSFSTITSHINLENEPKVFIHSDLSVRPKICVKKDRESERENISPKDSETNKIYLKDLDSEFAKYDFIESTYQNRDSETSKKRVSFASSQAYEGNVKIVGFMKSIGDATSLKSFEHHSCQPISDLPEEYQKHILSAPIFIDSEMLDSNEYNCRFSADNPISSSEVLPHIRWYPIPSYKSSQDIKNAATQTSLKHSKETGPSSEICIEKDKHFADSADAAEHLHMTETVDLSTLNFCSLLPDMQTTEDINLTSAYGSHYIDNPNIKHYSGMADEAGESKELVTSQIQCQLRQNVVESSDIIRTLHRKSIDRNDLYTSHLPLQELNFESNSDDSKRVEQEVQTTDDEITSTVQYNFHGDQYIIPGTFIDNEQAEQEFNLDRSRKVFKDASTQVKNCDCINQFKSMLKKALNKVPDEQVCPFHKILKKKLERTRQTRNVSLHSESFDVLFIGDNPHTVVDAENSPLDFNSILMSPLRYVRNRKRDTRLPKGERPRSNKEVRLMEEKKILLKSLYKNHAKKFSKQLANSAVKGKVDYTRHERVLKKSPFY